MGINAGQCWKKNPLDAAKDNDLNSDPPTKRLAAAVTTKRWFHKLRGAVFPSSPDSFLTMAIAKRENFGSPQSSSQSSSIN